MRKRFLGSIAALAAGAGAAWGQSPMPVTPAGGAPAAIARAGDIIPVQGPAPVIMPPIAVGPPGDPQGLGPTASIGPPPGPMYPNPGPYTAPMYQPAPPSGYGAASTAYFTGEYLIMFGTGEPVGFPLLTSGSPGQAGVLGQATTTTLVGGSAINFGGISGFRLGGGFFGDADRRFGFDFSSLYAQPTAYKKTFDANSQDVGPATIGGVTATTGSAVGAGIPVLARPFFDTNNGNTSLVLVSPSLPGAIPNTTALAVGKATVEARTSLWSADPSAMFNVFRSNPGSRLAITVNALVGYKYLQFDEEFTENSETILRGVTAVQSFTTGPFGVPVAGPVILTPTPVGIGGVVTRSPSIIDIGDRFVTTNKFNGGNFGLHADARYGMFTFSTTAKIGVGDMHEVLRIRGVTSFQNTSNGRSGFAYGGLLANSSNIGTYTNDVFTVIPDINATVGINLTKSLSMYVGYNVIYIPNALRPGSQLSPIVNSATVPFSTNYGASSSIPTGMKSLVQQEYWIQGASFGFAFKY